MTGDPDLLCKSMDWFLYDRNHHHERVKVCKISFLLYFFFKYIHDPIIIIRFISVWRTMAIIAERHHRNFKMIKITSGI